VLKHFLAAGMELGSAAAGFFEGGAFLFQLALGASEFFEALVGFVDAGFDFFA
jgi:hypothetical protein